jgi:hypothetical protein
MLPGIAESMRKPPASPIRALTTAKIEAPSSTKRRGPLVVVSSHYYSPTDCSDTIPQFCTLPDIYVPSTT